jgi:hypothetical protein
MYVSVFIYFYTYLRTYIYVIVEHIYIYIYMYMYVYDHVRVIDKVQEVPHEGEMCIYHRIIRKYYPIYILPHHYFCMCSDFCTCAFLAGSYFLCGD